VCQGLRAVGICPCFPCSTILEGVGLLQCVPGARRICGADGQWRGVFYYDLLGPLGADQEVLRSGNRHVKGLCFRCDEKFVPGHREECKRLFIIEVVSDDEVDGNPTDPTISLHALTGIQPCASKTMQLWVQIGDATIMALLDSSSTHNFLDTAVAEHINLTPQVVIGFHVAMANGDWLACSGRYTNLDINVVGEPFSITCYGLVLGSFEMVLGIQWLEALSPMLWDFHRHTLAFVRSGHRVVWTADSSPSSAATLKAVADDVMDKLL
jgi:hypothetical protein